MRKKDTVSLALIILSLSLIATGLSRVYWQENEQYVYIGSSTEEEIDTVSTGFPFTYYGYTDTSAWIWGNTSYPHWIVISKPTRTYWFSLMPFLADIAFWSAISFVAGIIAMKSIIASKKRRASKNLSVIDT